MHYIKHEQSAEDNACSHIDDARSCQVPLQDKRAVGLIAHRKTKNRNYCILSDLIIIRNIPLCK